MLQRVLERVVVVILAFATVARAEPGETQGAAPALPPRGTALVTEKATWQWQVFTAPRIAPQIGALAVSGLDAVTGRVPSPINVLGDPPPPPSNWPYTVVGSDKTIPAAPRDRRIASAWGVTTFVLTAADQGLAMLELRLRYEDGVAVWLNGVEIVRRALPRGDTTMLAVRQHGPEWETFYVPVASGMLRAGDNVLAVEVHPSGRRYAPALAAELWGRRDRKIVRGPIVADVDATRAVIAVETDPDTEAVLEWGIGTELDRKKVSPPGRHHRFELDGLPVNGEVAYRVRAGASSSPRHAFHTMPDAQGVLRIGVYGDVRGGHATHRRLVDHMLREGLDLVAVTGDMVLHGADEADWQRFFAVTAELLARVPYYPAVGNHDLGWGGTDDDATTPRRSMLAIPAGPAGRPDGAYWYSRDVAGVHLVFLDSNSYDRIEQETWLEVDLAAARSRDARAIIVFTHDGPFARGYHGGNAIARDRYVPILARHHVDLILAGHDHIYQRGEARGVRYVVTGGGGASLYNIRCGVAGRPKCSIDDGMIKIAREHHYLTMAFGRDLELCARRVDGTLLERCVRYSLWRR